MLSSQKCNVTNHGFAHGLLLYKTETIQYSSLTRLRLDVTIKGSTKKGVLAFQKGRGVQQKSFKMRACRMNWHHLGAY